MSGGMDPTQFVVDIQKRSPEDAKRDCWHITIYSVCFRKVSQMVDDLLLFLMNKILLSKREGATEIKMPAQKIT